MCTDHPTSGTDSAPEPEHSHHERHGQATQDAAAAGGADLAECPVMPGNMVVKADAEALGLFRDHEGTRYWLCCDSCGPLFDADPAEYVTAS